ncbi:bifunctional DNA primase/polymerase [Yinghuangia sp. YIM S10712]|uniref:bifunctional DNA primase/polymerase n=1 Tax=Yinghuangia sp. YIM S10712 TaxID=3436930 RepID=UPI003F531158
MEKRLCAHCSGELPRKARRDAQFCSGACRMAVCRARAAARRDAGPELPQELTARRRWVRRNAAKVPLTPAGRAASSTDRATWSTFAAVSTSTAGEGVGFVLADGDGIVCVDLDHCVDGRGMLAPWAAKVLRTLPASFTEVSPSGTGLHVWLRSPSRPGRRVRRAGGYAVEVYARGRYIAMTGRRHPGTPLSLAEVDGAVLDELCAAG